MSLINCQECNKKISDRVSACPHCGFPMQSVNNETTANNTYTYNGQVYDISSVLNEIAFGYEVKAIKEFRKLTNADISESKYEVEKLIASPLSKNFIRVNQVQNNVVKCPKCASTQIQLVKRNWNWLTGFCTNKVDRVCMYCKHKF